MGSATINARAVLGGGVVGIGVCVVAAMVGMCVHHYSILAGLPCECRPAQSSPVVCNPEDEERCCPDLQNFMKVPLIATHLIPFILMPVSMWVCQSGAVELQKKGMKSAEHAVLGLAYIMVSIAGEVGWHVHQRWFYQEEYDVLNFFFYAFNTLGASFWALGAQTEATKSSGLDALLMLCTPLTALTYTWGAFAATNSNVISLGKVPIYIIMSYQYGLLSWRLFKLLNNDFKVWLFPFFSVVVNLFFVYLLGVYEESLILNPVFHMLHDAAGTEMGILVITIILWCATSNTNTKND